MFHLVDPEGYRVGDVLDIFSKAAHVKMNLFVNAALLFVPRSVTRHGPGAGVRVRNAIMKTWVCEDMLCL